METGANQDAPASEQGREGAEQAATPSSGVLKSGVNAREAALKGVATRRARAAAREAEREDAAMTVRQRLAVAMSTELSTEDWKKVVAKARDDGKVAELARLADQAFGKPQVEEQEEAEEGVAHLTRAQRGALMARLLREIEEDRTASGDTSDPRA